MAYTPINWQTGDTITAEKLNKMDNGWSVGNTQLFSETVTTIDTGDGYARGTFAYTGEIPNGEVTVTFNGNEYTCQADDGAFGGTSVEFTEYPFSASYNAKKSEYRLYTAAAGTYTIAVETTTAETNDKFKAAVGSIAPLPMLCVLNRTTYNEMKAAADAGRLLHFWDGGFCRFITSFRNEESATAVTTVPAADPNAETFGFSDIDGTLVFQNFFA